MNIILGIGLAGLYLLVGCLAVWTKYRFALSIGLSKRRRESDHSTVYMVGVDHSDWIFQVMLWPLVVIQILLCLLWRLQQGLEQRFDPMLNRFDHRVTRFLRVQTERGYNTYRRSRTGGQ